MFGRGDRTSGLRPLSVRPCSMRASARVLAPRPLRLRYFASQNLCRRTKPSHHQRKEPKRVGLFSLVGVTGLEPATSRPPAVRATNCATPRRQSLRTSLVLPQRQKLRPYSMLLLSKSRTVTSFLSSEFWSCIKGPSGKPT